MRCLVVFVACVLLSAGIAYAQLSTGAWSTEPDGTTECTALSKSNSPCYYDFSATTDSWVLPTSACRDVNVWLNPDEDGTNTGAEVQIYRCEEETASANHCHKILGDTDGDGILNDVTLNGSSMRTGLQNVQADWIYVDVTANAGSDDARVTVECH